MLVVAKFLTMHTCACETFEMAEDTEPSEPLPGLESSTEPIIKMSICLSCASKVDRFDGTR